MGRPREEPVGWVLGCGHGSCPGASPENTTREEMGQNMAHPHSGPGWRVRTGHACPEDTDARRQEGGRPCSARAVGTVPSTAALKSR